MSEVDLIFRPLTISIISGVDELLKEKKAFKKLWEELKEKRKAEPNRVHFIRTIRCSLVSSDKNSVLASFDQI